MTYLKVLWNSSSPQMPIELFSELDAERYEIRKVERFRDGKLQFAGPGAASGDTGLGENGLPPDEVIAENPNFTICTLNAEEFEQVWQTAVLSKAA